MRNEKDVRAKMRRGAQKWREDIFICFALSDCLFCNFTHWSVMSVSILSSVFLTVLPKMQPPQLSVGANETAVDKKISAQDPFSYCSGAFDCVKARQFSFL